MEKVIVLPFVEAKLRGMVKTLHNIKYFGTLISAENYVEKLKNYIKTIPQENRRLTRNPKYGHFYCTYKPNSRTSYFITFDTEGDLFLIKNIFNNHTSYYPKYIRGVK